MANGRTVSDATSNVVVVASDADRLGQYEDALRRVQIPTRATLDADEAETFLSGLSPDVLVLDRGLPRLVLFRLYGMVRADASETPVQVVFVGQDGETGPDDHYLPGDPSPSNVAERVTQLLASANATPETATADDAAPDLAASVGGAATAPTEQPAESARSAAPVAVGAAASSAAAADAASSGAPAAADVAATNGVASDAVADKADNADGAEAPKRAGRRLDVIMIRVGLVLLILGALLILIQSDAFPPALVPPGSAPATPTRRPAASPTPGAFLDVPGSLVSAVVSRALRPVRRRRPASSARFARLRRISRTPDITRAADATPKIPGRSIPRAIHGPLSTSACLRRSAAISRVGAEDRERHDDHRPGDQRPDAGSSRK